MVLKHGNWRQYCQRGWENKKTEIFWGVRWGEMTRRFKTKKGASVLSVVQKKLGGRAKKENTKKKKKEKSDSPTLSMILP